MKHDLTTETWQDDTGCPISIILAATSDVGNNTCMRIAEVCSISHRFPSNRCCLACALTEKGSTLFKKCYRASSWLRKYRSWDCRWCNIYVRRARRPCCASRPCCHCVRHHNTIRCHHRVHRCWCVARWLPCCHRDRLVLILIVVVNVSLVAVVVVAVSACRHRVCHLPSTLLLAITPRHCLLPLHCCCCVCQCCVACSQDAVIVQK